MASYLRRAVRAGVCSVSRASFAVDSAKVRTHVLEAVMMMAWIHSRRFFPLQAVLRQPARFGGGQLSAVSTVRAWWRRA